MTSPSDQAPAPAAAPPGETVADLLKPEFDMTAENELLAEFERSEPASPAARPPVEREPPSYAERLLKRMAERERLFEEARKPRQPAEAPAAPDPKLHEQLGELQAWKAEIEAQRAAEQDRAEAEAVFARGAEVMAEAGASHLPADYAKVWLLNEAATNPALGSAWERRHESPEAARAAERAVDKALTRLHRHLASLPEPSLTADRALVSAAVRGASGQPPPERPPNYAHMTDADFNAATAKFGIKPL